MKQTFKISRIDGGVFAREVNPYEEYKMEFPWPDQQFDDNDYSHTMWAMMQDKWEEAENNLWEYQLTEESLFTGEQWPEYGYTESGGRIPIGMNRVMRKFEIGQIITGELVNENGVTKIKI